MEELNKHLQTFRKILNELSSLSPSENTKIGGSFALHLHGLNFRAPQDLDIIVYKPTPEQVKFLQTLRIFASKDEYGYERVNNIKIELNDLILNILVVERSITPILLRYNHREIELSFAVVGANEIINAKKKYNRVKDLQDFILLKNENFNGK